MRQLVFRGCLLAGLVLLSFEILSAQELRQLPLLDESTMRIDGTSNQSDYSLDVNEMAGTLWLSTTEDGSEPDSVFFITQSGKLKSGKSSIMDRLMYKALKSSQYPDIVYTLGSSGVIGKSIGDTLVWRTTGALYLAGVSDTLAATVAGLEESPGRFVYSGTHRMSMRQHDITPPTAMFGALHTSEWVTITFNLVFGSSEIESTGTGNNE